jgi:hypothetical protein
MDPQTTAIDYYLDGQLLDRWQPTDISGLSDSDFVLVTGTSAKKGTAMTGYIEDVKVGK